MVWLELVGPIPDGLQLDHVCRNRGCVNPDHLEPVTANGEQAPCCMACPTCARGHADWYFHGEQAVLPSVSPRVEAPLAREDRLMPTVNGADPWLIILGAVLTFLLVVTIGIIISLWRHEDHE